MSGHAVESKDGLKFRWPPPTNKPSNIRSVLRAGLPKRSLSAFQLKLQMHLPVSIPCRTHFGWPLLGWWLIAGAHKLKPNDYPGASGCVPNAESARPPVRIVLEDAKMVNEHGVDASDLGIRIPPKPRICITLVA